MDEHASAVNRDPGRITVPVLRSPALEKRWGKPRLLVGPKGGYALRYEDPANHDRQLTVFGSPQLFQTAGPIPPPYTSLGFDARKNSYAPGEVSQPWQSLQLAGRKVRYYIAEDHSDGHPAQYSTETFRLTAPDGRTASYRIRSASEKSKAAEDVASLMQTVSF